MVAQARIKLPIESSSCYSTQGAVRNPSTVAGQKQYENANLQLATGQQCR